MSYRNLRQHPSVNESTCLQINTGLSQYIPFKMAGCSTGYSIIYHPVNIFPLCTAAQSNAHRRSHSKGSGNLKYPDIIRAARNDNICWDNK